MTDDMADDTDDEYDDYAFAILHQGDATWHDGFGWYYVDADYPEWSVGAFASREEAIAHAVASGYEIRA